jgi:hypothetical protein
MMLYIHPILALLLLSHLFGDYYLQPKVMAVGKMTRLPWLIGHGLIHIICLAIVLSVGVYFSIASLWILLTMGITHILIDYLKRFVKTKSLIIDQLAHFVIIATVWFIWGENLIVRSFVLIEFEYMQKNVILIVLGLLCILRPIGVLIEQGDIWDFNKGKNPPDKSQIGAGKMIGYLERIIVYFLLLVGQYAAIAFVMTAKSVARFPEISKDGEGHTQA